MTVRIVEIRATRPEDPAPAGFLSLDHDARWIRRKALTADEGSRVMVDLPDLRGLRDGERLIGDDGRHFAVAAAPEALLEVTGPTVARYAWHVGNRHAPCRIEADRLLVRDDPVMRRMLEGLGAQVRAVEAPFEPEGGAYGHGRTHGHEH